MSQGHPTNYQGYRQTQDLRLHVLSEVELREPGLRVVFENEPFDPESESLTEWVQVVKRDALTQPMSFGVPADIETNGIFIATVFTLAGTGDGRALLLADLLSRVLQLTTIGTMETLAATRLPLPVDGRWFRIQVTVPFNSREFDS